MSATVSKWIPTTDPMLQRRMGKLIEECGELLAVAGRIGIQGIDEIDPGTGKVNRLRLAEELADVAAQIECTLQRLGLNRDFHEGRASRKRGYMDEWEAMFAQPAGADA